ncbi:DNA polymerase III subunit gamma/tau, partial [Candidatus Pacearchaeota archaeon]|nr:DNA polymerase III subunit gamma/tau [Candidatus Pacearchaeota archaeon]
MSLYLKYRPQNFKTIVGQDHITSTLTNAIKYDSLTHAYLFCGPRGTGKTSLARIIAKSLNCTNLQEQTEPCDECENCKAILSGRLVDLIEIDAASNRGIDEIRELREKILFAPTQGKRKIYIIDEVHMLTKEAFNALLKTLEEPPSHAYFILATTEAHKIPETIISRCQQFNFKRITTDSIVKRLEEIAVEEKVQAEPDALKLIAKMASGGLRDAIGLFEQMNMDSSIIYQEVVNNLGLAGHLLIESFFKALSEKDIQGAIQLIGKINAQGQNLHQFCGEFISYLREQMLLGVSEKKEVESIIQIIDIFSEAKQQVNQALIPQLPLEIAAIKACGYEGAERTVTKSTTDTAEVQKPSTEKSVEEPENVQVREVVIEKIETEAVSISNSELTLEEIKKNWQRILENIETPFIRMSFSDGEPVKLEGNELYMTFKSSTLMEKVLSVKNQ